MPDVRLKTRIQNKYKTLDEWNSLTKGEFIPLKGEICYATVNNDTVYQKIGDGITDFTELEWLNNVGIDVIDTFNDLSTSAKKDDIAFVKDAAFVETVEYQEEIPIVLTGGEQILNVEFKQDTKFIHETNIGEICPEVNDEENSIYYECGMATPNGEYIITYFYYPPSVVSANMGFEQKLDAYMIMQEDHDYMTQYYKFRGLSAKDFLVNVVGFPGTEEQVQVLLGEHYTDKSEDNPSYNWVKVIMSGESLNDNSVFLEDAGAYFTLEYDATVDIKGLLLFDSYGFEVMKMLEDGETESLFNINGCISYPDDNDEEDDFNEILKYGNAIVNIFLSGGIRDVSYDIYKQKGFHIYKDEKWASLEEKMNIPKITKTYSELPKSFVENGLMAVANEEIVLPEPTYDIDTSSEKTFEVNPTPSIENELDKIKQYFIDKGTEVDLENAFVYIEGGFFNPITEKWIGVLIGPVFNDGYNGIMLRISVDEDITRHFIYAEEAGMKIDIPDKGSPQEWTFTLEEGGCWYYYETEERGKNDYLVDIPKKLTEQDWFSILDDGVMLEGIYIGYETEDNYEDIELTSYEFDNLFKFYDLSKTQIYPQGFYQYSNNRWYHQPDITGASFDNEDILKRITGEDIGNIELNTEARHEHSNKYVLDQLPWDSYDKLVNQVPANTNARHTHSNQYYLNQITDSNYVHKHNNKTILDDITYTTINNINSNTSARHTHTNKTYLDRVDYTLVNNVSGNTQARHTHSNQSYLDQITGSSYVHRHDNKDLLDSIKVSNDSYKQLKINDWILSLGLSYNIIKPIDGIATVPLTHGSAFQIVGNTTLIDSEDINEIILNFDSYSQNSQYDFVSMIHFSVHPDTMITYSKPIQWINNIPHFENYKSHLIRFFSPVGSSDIFGEWIGGNTF